MPRERSNSNASQHLAKSVGAGSDAPRRIVIKIGSAVIARSGVLDPAAVSRIAQDIGGILHTQPGREVVIVSSGAVASGFRELGLAKPPKDIVSKQAAAAVGQPRLMSEWADAFAHAPGAHAVAQVLLTAEDIDHRTRFLNARRTLEALLGSGRVVPIINENDSVSFAEIKLGDNDHLSSLVASLVSADLLIILSSVSGVWAAGSKPSAPEIVPEIRSLAQGLSLIRSDKSDVGTGGMHTKITAACTAAALGTQVVIASGTEPSVVSRILAGEAIGTSFPPSPRSTAARKRWIGFSARPKGSIRVDAGAAKALRLRGASLLPSGITEVDGDFVQGALVEIIGPDKLAIARGMTLYAADDLRLIRGKKTSAIAPTLGYCYADEAVHRDDLVLLDGSGHAMPTDGARS